MILNILKSSNKSFLNNISKNIKFKSFSSSTLNIEKNYLLEYKYVKDILEKRDPFRDDHIKLCNSLKNYGLVAGGPLIPTTGAFFLFNSSDTSPIKKFIKEDSYMNNDLVTGYNIKEWSNKWWNKSSESLINNLEKKIFILEYSYIDNNNDSNLLMIKDLMSKNIILSHGEYIINEESTTITENKNTSLLLFSSLNDDIVKTFIILNHNIIDKANIKMYEWNVLIK
jgi:uncharacterized protein YciI